MGRLASSIKTPYFQVTVKAEAVQNVADNDYTATDEMISLAPRMMGFLGLETDFDAFGEAKTYFYWRDRSSLETWASFSRQHLAERRPEWQPCALPNMNVKWIAPPKPSNNFMRKIFFNQHTANSA